MYNNIIYIICIYMYNNNIDRETDRQIDRQIGFELGTCYMYCN